MFGPALWNALFDEVLSIPEMDCVDLVACAVDFVLIIAKLNEDDAVDCPMITIFS